jgi:hypothetical protein
MHEHFVDGLPLLLHCTWLYQPPTDISTGFEAEQLNMGRFPGPANATDEAKTNMESEKDARDEILA